MALISVSNNALSNITAVPAIIPKGDLTLIKSITASASASIEFINGTNGVVLDGTYSSYIFSFVDMHPSVDGGILEFQASTDGGSNYGVTITSSAFYARLGESDAGALLTYNTDHDLAQSTSYQKISSNIGNDNDQSASGTLTLFNPSSTTYVKHFISSMNSNIFIDYTYNDFKSGYFNDTNDLTNIKFQMHTGNIDAGTILMYGKN